jgi:hypothetical protein
MHKQKPKRDSNLINTGRARGLFYNAVSIWTVERRMVGEVRNDELEMILEETIVA